MKYIIPLIALAIGFVIGSTVVRSPLVNEISSEFKLSEEAYAFLEEMGRLYQDSPLTQEEYDEFVIQIRNYGDHVITLYHHEVLWVALYASAFIGISENQGIEKANEFARQQLERFKIQYEKGMNLGESQIAAEKLYAQITAAESEQ